MRDRRYSIAMLDWLACAARGRGEPAARAARELGDAVAFAGTAGHVLDFDDTYLPGIAHLSATTAPAALVVAAERGLSVGAALDAYAEGFEAMAAVARASHPELYDRGWHPTAVCGGVGAAVAATAVLGGSPDDAVALALARAGGLRAAFGSDAKSLQVGLAAATGVDAARLAAAGARMPLERAATGFEQATGGRYAEPAGGGEAAPGPAVADNWIKAWPSTPLKLSTVGGPCSNVYAVRYGIENLARRPSAGSGPSAAASRDTGWPVTSSASGASRSSRSAASIAPCVCRQHGHALIQLSATAGPGKASPPPPGSA